MELFCIFLSTATATCNALEKGDDCDELMLMRRFRDCMRERYEIVDDLINEYYRIAPKLVVKIDNEINGKLRYEQLWKYYIKNSIYLIKEKQFYEATVVYINMVQELSKIYDEPLMPGIQEKVEQWLSKKDAECNI